MIGPGGWMKTVAKLFADLVAWRWAPAAGLLAASTLFVLVVVGLVPSEIGVPVANTKLVPKTAGTNGPQIAAVQSDNSETTTASFGNAAEANQEPASPPQPRISSPGSDFGRRGFSPRLDRPDPPPTPATPPAAPAMQPPVAPAGGPIGGIFSRIQGALRPGGPAAQAAAAAQIASANAANAAAAPPEPGTPQPGAAAAAVPPPPGTPPTPGAAAPGSPAPGNPPAYPAVPGMPVPPAGAPPAQ
jgi:hypothetical protein